MVIVTIRLPLIMCSNVSARIEWPLLWFQEHVLISIFASAGANTAYAIDIVTIMRQYYGFRIGFVPSILL